VSEEDCKGTTEGSAERTLYNRTKERIIPRQRGRDRGEARDLLSGVCSLCTSNCSMFSILLTSSLMVLAVVFVVEGGRLFFRVKGFGGTLDFHRRKL
jgi:hypothetical protein